MQIEQLTRLEAWFDTYTRAFLTGHPETDSPLTIKIEHTARVCENIDQLARAMPLGEDDVRLARAIALFHDVGRFDQYRRFGTFNDRRSINHAALGIDVLETHAVLDALPTDEGRTIIEAVRFHNAPSLPGKHSSDASIFMRLIRDADKLDIWKVFADYYQRSEPHHPTVIQHLPDLPTWEASILAAIAGKRMARLKDMKSLNDMKLLQLSWVFDLNFNTALIQARERGDVDTIARTLPDDQAIHRAVATVMRHLETAPPAASMG